MSRNYTVCSDKSCPMREGCYRYRTVRTYAAQYEFRTSPRTDNQHCHAYTSIAGRGPIRSMEQIEGVLENVG